MKHTKEQTITQLHTYLALLQTKETLETYREFCYQLYLISLCNDETKQIAYITLGGKTIGTHTEVKSTYYDATDPRYHANRYNRYFHTDALGSITSVTNDAGTVVERRSTAPFGKIRAMNYGTNNNTIANDNALKNPNKYSPIFIF
ncbi:MAG: Unknown protein [uncultured Sulfurovum sp.]|uniref:Uncharacterized protein n=1 Tax=uncultured Sulfurovum sp. TaxID=269237 RepID=A0A6S6T1M2_9BACT|nr:MAG: Unknown protein [uncultured Sulfurovum sp.]